MLADTSVWVDHLRRGDEAFSRFLVNGDVECHAFVIGELACGNPRKRQDLLGLLKTLPDVPLAGHEEVLSFVESHRLMGKGIGWIDAHLLASTILAGTTLWTRDGSLEAVAKSLGIAFP